MRVDMAKKRMMDSSLVESVLGKNHSMIIDEDWYEHTIIDHLVDSMGYEHLFGPDVRRSSENYQDVFIPDVLRKHCLMSIKGCLRRQLMRQFSKLRILRVEVLSSGMKFLMTIFSLVWKSVILMVKKNGMKSFAF